MAQKKQTPKKSAKQKKRKRNPSNAKGSQENSPRGLMSGMRSGMQNVAAGNSHWLDITLWGLVIFALLALTYRLGWLGTSKPTPPAASQKAPNVRLPTRLPPALPRQRPTPTLHPTQPHLPRPSLSTPPPKPSKSP